MDVPVETEGSEVTGDSSAGRGRRDVALRTAEAYQDKIERAWGVRRLNRWLELRAVARAFRYAEGESVLDCPCGTGRLDAFLRARFDRVVGLDRSGAMLSVYRREHPERITAQGDVFQLPYADESFDWVVSHRLLQHFSTDDKRVALLRSLARVAKRGVIVYAWLDVPVRLHRSKYARLSIEQVQQLLGRAGLELGAVHYSAWPLQPKAELVLRKGGARTAKPAEEALWT